MFTLNAEAFHGLLDVLYNQGGLLANVDHGLVRVVVEVEGEGFVPTKFQLDQRLDGKDHGHCGLAEIELIRPNLHKFTVVHHDETFLHDLPDVFVHFFDQPPEQVARPKEPVARHFPDGPSPQLHVIRGPVGPSVLLPGRQRIPDGRPGRGSVRRAPFPAGLRLRDHRGDAVRPLHAAAPVHGRARLLHRDDAPDRNFDGGGAGRRRGSGVFLARHRGEGDALAHGLADPEAHRHGGVRDV
mmetsp:Transcript_789/g.1784  ORF Transcript_789/g.1784 Transcript_789/m.1784 type:complete len:241 (+) Transcript_789:1008-1730(+)